MFDILTVTPNESNKSTKKKKMELTLVEFENYDTDSIVKQALQWTLQGHRGRQRPSNTWKRDLEKKTSEKKRGQPEREKGGEREAGAQERTGWRRVSVTSEL